LLSKKLEADKDEISNMIARPAALAAAFAKCDDENKAASLVKKHEQEALSDERRFRSLLEESDKISIEKKGTQAMAQLRRSKRMNEPLQDGRGVIAITEEALVRWLVALVRSSLTSGS
jgi:hypothetical protein